MSEPSKPIPKLHEPNTEARARGYLRGAVVRWYSDIGIVVGHDRDGDPWIDFGGTDPEVFDATKSSLSLERPAPAPAAEPAPAPPSAVPPSINEALGLKPETPADVAAYVVARLRSDSIRLLAIENALGIRLSSR